MGIQVKTIPDSDSKELIKRIGNIKKVEIISFLNWLLSKLRQYLTIKKYPFYYKSEEEAFKRKLELQKAQRFYMTF